MANYNLGRESYSGHRCGSDSRNYLERGNLQRDFSLRCAKDYRREDSFGATYTRSSLGKLPYGNEGYVTRETIPFEE